nr:G-type lectin S-receptor-like serine/threonine-protein kinase At1g67520 [Ipomoea batatas]
MIVMGRIILVTIVWCLFIWHGLLLSGVSAKNTLAPGESLSPFDDEYLESSNKVFMLKFMKLPGSSSPLRCFLSIQRAGYFVTSSSEGRTIWVAWPGESESYFPELVMERDGRLLIFDNDQEFVVNDDEQYPFVMNTTATLLDTGNLVLRGGGRTLWQSFDHPTGNTWITGMKLGWFGLQKSPQLQQRCLTSWTSEENPSPGAFSLCVDPNNTKQLVAMRRGVVYWHSGVWNGNNFPFLQVLFSHLRYFSNHNESYFAWDGNFDAGEAFITIYASGEIYAFVEGHRNYTTSYKDIKCDRNDDTYYSNEGCLKSPKQSNCSAGDKFYLTTGFIESNLWEQMLFNTTLNIGDCKEMCVQNCSCNAYATLETDGTGCKFSSSTEYHYTVQGDTLYIRYVGLLCVQDSATDRPTMTDVVSMLGNESTILPIPKQPGFSAIIGLKCGDVANNSKSCSINEVTITEIEGR